MTSNFGDRKERSRGFFHFNAFIVFLIATVVLIVFPAESAVGQKSRKGDRQNQQSANKQRKPQDGSKTSKKQTLSATAIVHVKGGKKHEAAKVEKQRNGDYKVTVLDGSTITIARRDFVKLEKIADNTQQKKARSPSKKTTKSSSKSNKGSSPSRTKTADRSKSASKSSSNKGVVSRNTPPVRKPMPIRGTAKKQPKKIAQGFMIQMSDGQKISGVSIKQLNRKLWQVTSENDKKMTIDRSKIGSITDLAGGQKLKMIVGRNGEIIPVIDDGDESSNTTQPASGEIGSRAIYDTLSDNSTSISKTAVRQAFLASCNDLKSVSIKLEGSYDVEVRVCAYENDSVLGQRTATVNNNGQALVSFSPAVSLIPGERYRIEVERSDGEQLTAFVTNNDEYVFSRMQYGANWSSLSDNNKQNDLVMRVKGNSPVNLPTSIPSQKALLVLLENDGIVGSLGAAGIDYPDLPDVLFMVYTGNEREIEFKLNKNESISHALTRVGSELDEIAEDEIGSPPKPPKIVVFGESVDNPTDPEYLQELAEYNAELAAFTVKLASPSNWEIRTESANEFVSTISDLVIEEFTRSFILEKTQDKYDHVVVIEDSQFEAPNVLAAIEQLAPNYLVDVHVLSHGSVNKISGHDTGGTTHELTRSNFFIPLQQARLRGNTPLRLRTVYQCICTGGSLKREWIALGAQAVNGTRGEVSGEAKKNYMPQQYIHFLDYWCDQDKSFGQSTELSFVDASNYSKSVYSALSSKQDLIEDSELTVSGDGSIKRSP